MPEDRDVHAAKGRSDDKVDDMTSSKSVPDLGRCDSLVYTNIDNNRGQRHDMNQYPATTGRSR